MLCKLCYKKELRPGLFDFVVDCPKMTAKAKPGMFVHVLCGSPAYLRRPISICDASQNRFLRFVFEIRGKGTAELAKANPGQMLDILGPLGNGFDTNPPDGRAVLIGGGIGIFPLLMLSKQLSQKPDIMLGFRDKQSAVMIRELSQYANDFFLATDDGSLGMKGFVTDILGSKLALGTKYSRVYTCGPVPMMKIVAQIAKEQDIECQISLEERMGCGVGACMTCTCTMTDGTRRRVCKDGPVFNGMEVDFCG